MLGQDVGPTGIVAAMTQPLPRVLDHHPGEHRDEANKLYGIRRLLPEPVPTTSKLWTPGPNLLDQLDTGHCGGMAAANEAQASPVRVRNVDTGWGHAYYYEIKDRKLDPWGREEGTSTQAVMNLGRIRGLWAGYAWGFDISDTYRQLEVGPVLAGTSWLTNMFYPNPDGVISATGRDEGGHLWCVIGRYRNYRGPATGKTYGPALKIRNSWGPWGLRGSAVIPEADAAHVIYGLDGECGVPLQRAFPPVTA